MALRDTAASGQTREFPRRDERAHRILDAAGQLVLRWGYDKTTIDDIARAAGVAKGTIYLHWNTREALFAALLRRDRATMVVDVRDGVAAHPDGVTFHGLVRQLGLALMRRPLMKALFFGDAEVLGKFLRDKPNSETTAALRTSFESYLDVLRERGAIRADLSLPEQVNVFGAAVYGFFLIPPLMPPDYKVADERLADLLAETVHRTLTSGRDLSPSDAEAISTATLDHLDRAVEVAEEKARQSLATKEYTQ